MLTVCGESLGREGMGCTKKLSRIRGGFSYGCPANAVFPESLKKLNFNQIEKAENKHSFDQAKVVLEHRSIQSGHAFRVPAVT